jgi:hypothetical protein
MEQHIPIFHLLFNFLKGGHENLDIACENIEGMETAAKPSNILAYEFISCHTCCFMVKVSQFVQEEVAVHRYTGKMKSYRITVFRR